MLQILQTGKVLYVLAALCAIGTISKLVTGGLYKRLIKETGNMALTKNKNLRALKQKTENTFLVSHGVRNASAYIEKQLYGFQFMKISLNSWDHLAVQTMILSFMIGGIAAFGAYWYRCDTYYIVLYGTMGILSGLFMIFVDNAANVSGKRQHLADCLVDYVENSPHFYRNVDKRTENMDAERKGAGAVRELRRKENISKLDSIRAERTQAALAEEKEENGEKLRTERQGRRIAALAGRKERKEPVISQDKADKVKQKPDTGEDELARSIDYLKQSLDQIAASREKEKKGSEVDPEQLKIIGDFLAEYLSQN